MINLIGTYECTVDNKGRIMIPSQLKKQLDGVMTKTFILKRSVFQNCLELFPHEEWKSVMDKVNKLNRFVKKNNDFIRMYTAGVRSIDMDSNGRILIPKDLITISKLNKQVVLSSSINIIEGDSFMALSNNFPIFSFCKSSFLVLIFLSSKDSLFVLTA